MAQMLHHLRYALRGLRKTPVFTAAVVLTLALGIGASSAVFSVVDAVLLRPLPYPDAGRLVQLAQFNPKAPQQPFVAPVRLEDWNRLNTTFAAISGSYAQDDSEVSGELPEKLKHAFVAPRFLQVWGISPELGRDFRPEEEHFNGPSAVLISDRFWRRRFGADPHVLGRTLRVGTRSIPIVGVMAPSFTVPDRDVDLWSPSPPDGPFPRPRELTWFTACGRIKPGVTLEQARADLATVQSNLGKEYPATDAKLTVSIEPLKELTVGGVRGSLWILFGSVTLLLLIACSNIAALLLSRAAGRRREIALRFSLGASRGSIAAQLLVEVLVLAVAGAGCGLMLAGTAARIFKYLASDLPRVDEIGLDPRVVGYALVCSLVVTFLCGIFPALRSTRRDLAASLAQAGRSQVSQRNPLQFALVGTQIALAVTLLAGAGLLVRSMQALGRVSPGFEPEHVLTFHMTSSWAETGTLEASKWAERVVEGLRTVPGVEAASSSLWLPGVPGQYQAELKSLEGSGATDQKLLAENRRVTPEYFATLRIPLLSGELCRADGPPSMMVNRSFASAYLGGSAAVGHHLLEIGNPWATPAAVSGIVGDARESGLDAQPSPTVYWCNAAAQPGTYFLVRTHGSPMAMAQTIRRKVHEIEPGRSVYDLTPLTDHISDAYAQNRMRTILLAFFALSAIALCSVGLYGTLSYLVSLRRREVGLRLALGAMRSQIVRQFVWRGVRVCLAGTLAGLALAAWLSRLIATMLYGVSPWDGITLAGVISMVLALSVAASVAPALRAARLDPAQVLRQE
jgi:putative ABC transport system permease protein